jgi:hypothetical protein
MAFCLESEHRPDCTQRVNGKKKEDIVEARQKKHGKNWLQLPRASPQSNESAVSVDGIPPWIPALDRKYGCEKGDIKPKDAGTRYRKWQELLQLPRWFRSNEQTSV